MSRCAREISGPVVVAGSLGAAEAQRAGALDEPGGDLVEDRPLHVDPLGAQAHLAGVGEDRAGQPVDRRVEVGVGEDQRGVLAAQLERDRPHRAARRPA